MAVVHTKCHFVPHSYQNATGRASIVGTCQALMPVIKGWRPGAAGGAKVGAAPNKATAPNLIIKVQIYDVKAQVYGQKDENVV